MLILPIWHPRKDEKGNLVADLVIHGLKWSEMPLSVRQQWWRETDYGRKPPSQEFLARLPQLMAAEQAKVENKKREAADDTAHARTLLSQARQPPCEQCLRPASPCKERCLRSMLG